MFATDIYLEELPSCWWHINFKEAVLQRPCNTTEVQCNLDLVTLNLVTTCDLVTILHIPFFNLLLRIIQFSDIMRFSDNF